MTPAAIWIDPARLSGEPCLHGHRLTVEHVATGIAAEGCVDAYMDAYDLAPSERRNVLCAAAWWVLNTKRGPRWQRELRAAWRDWAAQTWDAAWHTTDPRGVLTDPPEVKT